jgi:hypothetical protein
MHADVVQAEDVMTRTAGGVVLRLQESYDTLMDVLDSNKTMAAFPVVTLTDSPQEPGDFKGIISRARCAHARPSGTGCVAARGAGLEQTCGVYEAAR